MNDDLDEEIIGSEDGFDEFVQKNTLGDVVRNSPVAKIGVIVLGLAVIVGVIYMMGGDTDEAQPSRAPMASEVSAVPGQEEVTPAYREAVEEANEQDLERALAEGDSTLPVPIEPPSDRLQLPEEEEDSEDPLHRWRRLQEERVMREMTTTEEVEPVTVLDSEQQNEAMKEMAESMAQQMQTILGRQTERKTFSYVGMVTYDQGEGGTGGGGLGGNNTEFDGELIEEELGKLLIPAGEVEYGQLLIEANSDVPGPVLAELASGPYTGSRMLGTFDVSNDYLVITFDTLVVDTYSYDIEAIMLDPDTTLPGMATEVDHRYLQRVILPAAAAFVEGFADAVAQTDSTSITIDTSGGGTTTTAEEQDLDTEEEVALGVSEAGQEVREILDEMADEVEVLVRIAAGTPIGVLFTDELREDPQNDDS